MPITVRIRCPDGRSINLSTTSDTSLAQFMHAIEQATTIPVYKQELMVGYPPKAIDQALENSVEDAGIKQSAMITLKERTINPLEVAHQPDDNSCLFHAIAFGFNDPSRAESTEQSTNQSNDPITATQLREEACNAILRAASDPSSELAPFIQSINPLDRYVDCMQKTAWGGAIECAVLSQLYNVEIVTIDVETVSIIPFNIGGPHDKRMFLLYSGIHYDCLFDQSTDQRLFDVDAPNAALTEARALMCASNERAAGNYTNTDTFALMCSICKTKLKGSIEANQHAQLTGHAEFQETK